MHPDAIGFYTYIYILDMICYPNFNGLLGAIQIYDVRPCLQLNIRSYKKIKSEIEAILESLKLPPDVIAISETWLTSDSSHHAYLHGYRGYHAVRDSPYG